MIFGQLIIVSVAVLLSTVACKEAGLYELPVTNENGSMALDTDMVCRTAGFVPINHKKVSPPNKSSDVDELVLAGAGGAGGQSMSASTIILVVLGVVVGIISTVFLGNFLYNKAKANEYTL